MERTPVFEFLDDKPGVAAVDPAESVRFPIHTETAIDPTPTPLEEFTFGVEAAVTFETTGLRIPKYVSVVLRSPNGEFLGEFSAGDNPSVETYPPHAYSLQITTTPIALYLRVEGAVALQAETVDTMVDDKGTTRIRFLDGNTTVALGIRSFHESPGTTVSIPPDPSAMMDAIAGLSSGLTTLSPERSFPTLRGHAPAIEIDESASPSVPESLTPPSTDITLEVPADLDYLYPAAPLAYYLGADLREHDSPRLVVDGDPWALSASQFADDVGQLLERCLLLDVVVRSVEGLFQVELADRRRLEQHLSTPLEYGALYEARPAARLKRYLSVSDEAVDAIRTQWHHTLTISPDAQYIEALPYVVHHLPKIRTPSLTPEPASAGQTTVLPAVNEFVRGSYDGERTDGGTDDIGIETAGDQAPPKSDSPPEQQIALKKVETQSHAYLGDGYPTTADGKVSIDALQRRQEFDTPDPGQVSVTIVCADDQMTDEPVKEAWARDFFQFDIQVITSPTVAELTDLLAQPTDFLHYIGHVTADGLQCDDGFLDIRDLEAIGVQTFLANGCTSFRQGEALIEAGAKAGVITTQTVTNFSATLIGRALVKALNAGYSLRGALAVVKSSFHSAGRYTYLGDGGVNLVQSELGTPFHLSVTPMEDGERFRTSFSSYPTLSYGAGSHTSPTLPTISETFLSMGEFTTVALSFDELDEYLSRELFPVTVDGELYWSREVSATDLEAALEVDE